MANKTIDMIKKNFEPAVQLLFGIGIAALVVTKAAESVPTLGYKKEEQKAPAMTAKQQAALNYVLGAGY